MRYANVCRGVFIERPNRFIAMVEIDGRIERCHVKNTGRCKEILIKGVDVVLSVSDDPKRSTKYDLIAVYKGDMLINIDSQAPNKAAVEAFETIFGKMDLIRPEYKIDDSRIDIYAESGKERYLVEVKGVTLEKNGTVLFPDAPTERGLKHVRELTKTAGEGYYSYVLFIVQMKGVTHFEPNYEMHREFGEALEKASKNGVGILAYYCRVTEDSMTVDSRIPVVLAHSYEV